MNGKTVENNMLFVFTKEQQKIVCEHFGKSINELEFYEICELLDKVIDNLS